MMSPPSINISQSLYDGLKTVADPFQDTTPEAVIQKLLDFYRQTASGSVSNVPAAPKPLNAAMIFPPDGPPDLRFTKLVSVSLDGKPMAKSMLYWNSIMFELVQIAIGKLSPNDLRQAIVVNFVEGEGAKEKGYRFFPDAGLSVQGQDANQAWAATAHLAKILHMNLDVVMKWEVNDKAAYPGQTGQMSHKAV